MHDQKANRESHTWTLERLSEYLDDRLSPLERVQVERHIQTCQQCQHELDSLRWTIALVQAAPKPRLPRQFTVPVPAAPVRAPLFGLSTLRLATALATLVLVSLIGIDLIMQYGGGTAGAPAPLSSAQFAAPTRAALIVPTEPELRRDSTGGAAEPPNRVQATPTSTAAMPAPLPQATSAPRAVPPTAAPVVAATATPQPTLTPTAPASKAFSGPASATRSGPDATATSTPFTVGLGAGPVATLPMSKATDSSSATSVPTEVPPAAASVPGIEPTATDEPSAAVLEPTAASSPSVEAYLPPTSVPIQPSIAPQTASNAGIPPLRIAELATLFVAVFLGALLVLLGLRR